MDIKGVNPFLFNEDDYTSPHSTTSNPFLMGDEDNFQLEDTGNDNPFLSQTTASVASNSTNPFAFDPMDLAPSESETIQYPTNTFVDVSTSNNQDVFAATTTTSQDFFSINEDQDLLSNVMEVTPQKPTDLDLKYTNTVANGSGNVPARPPPPRPPPSKETQDLLMSVMGAMDATSSHLLDRIPPTRTPSPVSMRDLHSPSPTPEPNFGDLLDVGGGSSKNNIDSNTDDLLSLNQDNSCDINQNPPNIQENVQINKPAKPARPPRPKPPTYPPQTIQNNPAPPPKPPPPTIPEPEDEMLDMFGVENTPVVPKVATKADILNLYNAPLKQEKTATDLFFDTVEPEAETISAIEEPVILENLPEINQAPEPLQEPVVQDNFISPEPSQNDLQMDTSDSQSKGSVSSVTFNPFAASEDIANQQISPIKQNDLFQQDTSTLDNNVFTPNIVDNQQTDTFGIANSVPQVQDFEFGTAKKTHDEFDVFAQKFESVKDENKNGGFDAFSGSNDAWGNDFAGNQDSSTGFGADESFDAFLALQEPPSVPQSTPNRVSKAASQESDEDKDFSVFIKPKSNEEYSGEALPTIAPPPAPVQTAFNDTSPRFNPFDQQNDSSVTAIAQQEPAVPFGGPEMKRTDSQETPPTPLYDEDVSQPLEPFPRINYTGEGWEMHLRQPNKKKITGQRFWKKIVVKIVYQADCVLLQLFNQQSDKDPFQELPLQPCYSVSEIGAQQYDQFGKIFTIKLQYIFYKERPGVRPGQVKKAERITNKLSQFAAYAIQGDYQGVKEFGSDLKKLGLPVEHAPQVSQLMKLGSLNYEDLKQFSFCIEEALFRLQAHRDRALHYKMEEVQITLVDELYVEQDADGHVEKQIARVRLFFLGFLTGMPDIELGVNDMRRQGKEVVGRHDIIPVVTEEWIRLEDVEFHSCVQQEEYSNTHIIKFKPPDACYIELMRFRVRPPKNRELPLQLKATICITGNRVELRADVLVPGFASRKLGQIPCEDVMIRFPIPECWIYLFRVEKHFRYGSVKSAHRRTGKIKGIERILGTVDTLQESLIEVTSGQAKYEHQHRAIVWRCPRLPKEGQGAYTTHNMVCKMALTSYDQMPDKLAEYCYVEFTMPATQVSHTTCRSVSLQNSDSDEPPEKYVRYLARHEYRVGIEHTEGEGPSAYAAATFVKTTPKEEEKPAPVPEEDSSSDSD
ncbi:stoned-B-like [Asbolus verrucosus]|uniref:Stoned-B-like n=1 Tax=Asbolus verrucosus TaxID=1661398 RepID=A0A482W7Y8_ASBVE|nr:stoned-B-like [Asbolus verrucosus]